MVTSSQAIKRLIANFLFYNTICLTFLGCNNQKNELNDDCNIQIFIKNPEIFTTDKEAKFNIQIELQNNDSLSFMIPNRLFLADKSNPYTEIYFELQYFDINTLEL